MTNRKVLYHDVAGRNKQSASPCYLVIRTGSTDSFAFETLEEAKAKAIDLTKDKGNKDTHVYRMRPELVGIVSRSQENSDNTALWVLGCGTPTTEGPF